MTSKICSFKSLGVVTLPDVFVPFGIKLQIEPTLLIENIGEPRVITPVRFYDYRVVRLLAAQKVVNGVALATRVPFAQI